MSVTEVVEPEGEELPSFTDENDREIAYRAEAVPSSASPSSRPAVVTKTGGTGRRKEAVARVRLIPGTGTWTINGRTLEDYFPNKVHQQIATEPMETAAVVGSYDVIATLTGGGITGQAGALRLGIARALINLEPEDRGVLKKAGFLTRDPRVKERKKYGLKKARKAPQYSKR